MNHLTEDDLKEAISQAFMSTDFKLLRYKLQKFSSKSYLGNHYKISIEFMYANKQHLLYLFSKCQPDNKKIRTFVKENGFFSKEAHFYVCFAPEMNNLLPSELPLPIPLCYIARGPPLEHCSAHTCSSDEESILVLEDLNVRGYHMCNKCTTLDLPHCKLVLKALAVFHGGSFLLQKSQENSEEFGKSYLDEEEPVNINLRLIKESVFIGDKNHLSSRIFRATAESTATVMFKLWRSHIKHVDYDRLVENLWGHFQTLFSLVHPSSEYSNVVCHGDLRYSNILFTYDKDVNGVTNPVDVKLVDLQYHRFAPPATDILFFIYTCTRREFRDKNLPELLSYYYKELGRVITPRVKESFITKSALENSVKKMKIFGIMVGIHVIPFVLEERNENSRAEESTSAEKPDILEYLITDRSDQILKCIGKNPEIKERIEEIYREYLEYVDLWCK